MLALQQTIGNQAVGRLIASLHPRPAAPGAAVQRALPTLAQFQQETNAGLFATRDDVLKQIDKALADCLSQRIKDSDELWYASGEWKAKSNAASIMASWKRSREGYQTALGALEKLLNAWLSSFADDKSSAVALRREPVQKLLAEVRADMQKKPEERVEAAQQRENAAQEQVEAAVRADRELYTVERFKEESKVGVLESTFGPAAEVMTALKAYHAVEAKPGDDKARLAKLAALQPLREASDLALSGLSKLMSRPGYEKGHLGFQKEGHGAMKSALQKLGGQAQRELLRLETTAERDARAVAIRGAAKDRDDLVRRQQLARSGVASTTQSDGDWEVVNDSH